MSELAGQVALILSQNGLPVRVQDQRTGDHTHLPLADFDKPVTDFSNTVLTSGGANVTAVSEQLSLLRVLYSSIAEDQRTDFWAAIRDGLTPRSGAVIGHLIVELRRLDQIPTLTDRSDKKFVVAMAWLWNAIRTKLSLQPSMFSDADLINLINQAAGIFPVLCSDGHFWEETRPIAAEVYTALGTAHRVQYLRLKDQLLKVENPEINTNRRELVSRFESLNFSPKLIAAIDAVERKIREAVNDLDFRGCMDLMRLVFEETFEESAKRIESKVGSPAPTGPKLSNFQPFKQYLQNARLLSEKEAEVVQKLYNYMSQEGSHSLSSAPEQLRVTKNTIIEWSLMLVGRVQAFVG